MGPPFSMTQPTYIDDYTRVVSLNPKSTALLVVDMQYASGSRHHGLGKVLTAQNKLHEAEPRFTRIDSLIVPNTKKLIAAFRSLGAKVIYVTYGSLLPDHSDAHLKSMGISELAVVGVSTNNCVGMTAMEASDRQYGVVIVSDATGTCSDEMQAAYLDTFRRLWGRVMTSDEVIADMRRAG